MTIDQIPSGTKWVYDHHFFILLNFAVGGTWPGAPTKSTVFPATYEIDYVRVYEYINTTTTTTSSSTSTFHAPASAKHKEGSFTEGGKSDNHGTSAKQAAAWGDTTTGPKHMGPAPAFP